MPQKPASAAQPPPSRRKPSKILRSRAARDALILRNLGLAYHVAHRFWRAPGFLQRAGSLEDAEQVALLGLIRAGERWEPQRGAFSTCAVWWIRSFLHRYAIGGGVIHVPSCGASKSRKPGQERLAEQVRQALALQQWPVLQNEHGDWGEPEIPAPEELEQEQNQALADALRFLAPRERQILERRFGLDGKPAQTLYAVAGLLHLSKQRVCQLQKKALEKLRRRLGRGAA